MAPALPLRVVGDDLVDGAQPTPVLVDAKAHRLQRVEDVPLRLRRPCRVERVHERLQVAAGGDVGVDLADAARGGVARIDEARLARRLHLAIQLLKPGDREVNLTAHLEHVGQALRGRDLQRHAADRAQVGGHVLAGRAVAARGRALEPALGVGQADGQTVDLELGAVHDLVADRGPHAPVEGPDLGLVEGVLEAEHG